MGAKEEFETMVGPMDHARRILDESQRLTVQCNALQKRIKRSGLILGILVLMFVFLSAVGLSSILPPSWSSWVFLPSFAVCFMALFVGARLLDAKSEDEKLLAEMARPQQALAEQAFQAQLTIKYSARK